MCDISTNLAQAGAAQVQLGRIGHSRPIALGRMPMIHPLLHAHRAMAVWVAGMLLPPPEREISRSAMALIEASGDHFVTLQMDAQS
jgi:hypothetical protein